MIHPASHFLVHIISRGKGRSAIAAAAYISRTRMRDRRIGRTFNYQRIPGLLDQGLVNWKGSRQDLWNAAEKAETRCNSRVARELRPALPAELPLADQTRLVHGFCCWLKDEFGVASHYAIHAPTFHKKSESAKLWAESGTDQGLKTYIEALNDPAMTNRNYHAHIMISTRAVDTETGQFGRKVRELDNITEGRAQILRMRKEWERRTNAALKKTGSSARIDLRSYKDMAAQGDAPDGLEAQPHLGPLESAKVRKEKKKLCTTLTLAENGRDYRQGGNEELWTSWHRHEELQREMAQLISEKREEDRRKRAADEKAQIATAQTHSQLVAVIEAATTIDAMSYDPIILKRIELWSKSNHAASTAQCDTQSEPVTSEGRTDQVVFDGGELSGPDMSPEIEDLSLSSHAVRPSSEKETLTNSPADGMSNEIADGRKRCDDPMTQAIAWSRAGGPLPSSDASIGPRDSGNEIRSDDTDDTFVGVVCLNNFDEPIDPETFILPLPDAPKTPRKRIKQQQRGIGPRVRGR